MFFGCIMRRDALENIVTTRKVSGKKEMSEAGPL